MKVLITLAGTALSQTVLPETLPFGDGFGEYDLGDYSLSDYGLDAQEADVPYALLDSLADDPDAVVDYFESGKNKISTVPNHNSHTPNSHTYPNSRILFCPNENVTFWVRERFRENQVECFSRLSHLILIFLLFLKNYVRQD